MRTFLTPAYQSFCDVFRLLEQPPEKQQLLKGSQVLEDAKKLADLKVENDGIIALTFQQDNGEWEAVDYAE